MNNAPLLVAILNWHSVDTTLQCLEAVRRSRGVEADVLVVDNGSTDGSAVALGDALAGAAGEAGGAVRGVHLLALPHNTGYAGGMNAALAWAASGEGGGAEQVLLLTPDALVSPETIARLVAALEADPDAAIAGPVVVYRAGPERLIGAGGIIDRRQVSARLHRVVQGDVPYPVDWIDGCCMLVRRAAVAGVGGFDEDYFLYYEETDLCARVRRAGWRVWLVPGAEVWHEKVGAPASYYYYYMNRNRYHFWRKNFGVHPARVALSLARETGELAGTWVLSLLHPGRRDRRAGDGERLAGQLRGLLAGSRDYGRGRFGAMPQRVGVTPPPDSPRRQPV